MSISAGSTASATSSTSAPTVFPYETLSAKDRHALLAIPRQKVQLYGKDGTLLDVGRAVSVGVLKVFCTGIADGTITLSSGTIRISSAAVDTNSVKYAIDWMHNSCKTASPYCLPVRPTMVENLMLYKTAMHIGLPTKRVWPCISFVFRDGYLSHYELCAIVELFPPSSRLAKHLVHNLDWRGSQQNLGEDETWFIRDHKGLQRLVTAAKETREEGARKARAAAEEKAQVSRAGIAKANSNFLYHDSKAHGGLIRPGQYTRTGLLVT